MSHELRPGEPVNEDVAHARLGSEQLDLESSPLRVLRVCERLPPCAGGKEIHVRELTLEQRRQGDNVHLFFAAGHGLGGAETRVGPPPLLEHLEGAKRSFIFSSIAALRSRRYPADVVHIHGTFVEVIPFLLLNRMRRKPPPIVLTVHGGLGRKYRRASGFVYRRVDRIVALGSFTTEQLRDRGVRTDVISTMSSGICIDEIQRHAGASKCDPQTIGVVGSLIPLKNVDTVIAAFQKWDNVDWHLRIIGDGPERLSLKERAASHPRISFAGNLARHDLYSAMAGLHMFVLASRRDPSKSEGVSTALLEAMAMGVPCLVSSEAAPSPVVDASVYESFDPRDVQSLVSAMDRVGTSPSLQLELGARGKDATVDLDWAANCRRIRRVLTDAASIEKGKKQS